MMRKKFSLAEKDLALVKLMETTNHRTLAVWAIDCAERVLPYFEKKYPLDKRPRKAIDTLQEWIRTGAFSMRVIRKASLDAHAAAREIGEDSPARSAARAAGQAVATAHVRTHAIGPALYALQAIDRATDSAKADIAIVKERKWQYERLKKLIKKS